MSTSDPSLVATATLFASLRADVESVNRKLWDAAEVLREARVTLAELERRASTPPATPNADDRPNGSAASSNGGT